MHRVRLHACLLAIRLCGVAIGDCIAHGEDSGGSGRDSGGLAVPVKKRVRHAHEVLSCNLPCASTWARKASSLNQHIAMRPDAMLTVMRDPEGNEFCVEPGPAG
jgi:hypothetical protein